MVYLMDPSAIPNEELGGIICGHPAHDFCSDTAFFPCFTTIDGIFVLHPAGLKDSTFPSGTMISWETIMARR